MLIISSISISPYHKKHRKATLTNEAGNYLSAPEHIPPVGDELMSYAGPVSPASRRPRARAMAARFSGVLTRANQFKRDIAHVNKLTLGQSYHRSPPDIISWGQRR